MLLEECDAATVPSTANARGCWLGSGGGSRLAAPATRHGPARPRVPIPPLHAPHRAGARARSENSSCAGRADDHTARGDTYRSSAALTTNMSSNTLVRHLLWSPTPYMSGGFWGENLLQHTMRPHRTQYIWRREAAPLYMRPLNLPHTLIIIFYINLLCIVT